jgi:hypothetical protein
LPAGTFGIKDRLTILSMWDHPSPDITRRLLFFALRRTGIRRKSIQ